MELKDSDFQALQELQHSTWWKIVCERLDERIKAIENVLLTPDLVDMLWTDDLQKQINTLNYKKAERTYLLKLKDTPQELINTKILTNKVN